MQLIQKLQGKKQWCRHKRCQQMTQQPTRKLLQKAGMRVSDI